MTDVLHCNDSNPPTISIVLPTHNGSRYIDQSITSVVNQTWQDWELVIINDASTDRTPMIIDSWAQRDPRIRVIHLTTNRKLPGALNEGFARARGRFHTWTSDDNWYHRRALATMLAALEEWPAVSIVCADRTNVNQYGSLLAVSEADAAEDLHVTNGIGACFLYRREVTSALNGYDEDLFGAEDYDFWLRASLRFRFRRVAEPLYFYRFQPGSLSARKHRLIAKNVEIAVRRWLPQATFRNDKVRTQAYVEWGVRCLRAGTLEEVFEPWLRDVDWLDSESLTAIRRVVLERAKGLAWEAHWRRDWNDFDRFKRYLSEIKDDPAIARFVAMKLYPRWLYILKDRINDAGDKLRASLPGIHIRKGL
jgi:GT2 family glycosyltransferase